MGDSGGNPGGRFFGHGANGDGAGVPELHPEEKKTDVNIASHMLVDAFTDQFDVAFLLSGVD